MEAKLIEIAEKIVENNQEAIAKVELEICNIGCQFCANCSGIVGG